MQVQCYCIRDNKAQLFLTPFFVRNVNDALRQVQQAQLDQRSLLFSCAEDYELMLMCHFDDETGIITLPATEAPMHVIFLPELKAQKGVVK